MYVCISLYSLPFYGFWESSRMSTNKSLKITQKTPKVICTVTWSLFPGDHWPLYDRTYSLKVGSEPPEPQLKYLENFHWYPGLRNRTPNLLLGSRVYYHLNHRCSYYNIDKSKCNLINNNKINSNKNKMIFQIYLYYIKVVKIIITDINKSANITKFTNILKNINLRIGVNFEPDPSRASLFGKLLF